MDTQFNWLGSLPPAASNSDQGLAPPPVSFSVTSEAVHEKDPKFHTLYANASADSFSTSSQDPGSVPLSLQASELTLEESKTYMRWYSDILARTDLRTIAISDVYQFLSNFKIPDSTKEKIDRIFYKILRLINIGEFFALLRVVSHALQGVEPLRLLITIKTGVPVPPSILSKKRQNEESEDDAKEVDEEAQAGSGPPVPLDLDLFTQFMLTGERPGEATTKKKLKKLKSVKFSDQIVSDIQDSYVSDAYQMNSVDQLDYLLPMDQLLTRINASRGTLAVPLQDLKVSSPDPEEKQILKDMESQMNHFRNLHSVDTILVDGVPANIHVGQNSDFALPRGQLPLPLLKPNMTGPAQMAQMGTRTDYEGSPQPLRPNVTGPADMARLFAPGETPRISLQSFASQISGDTEANTRENALIGKQPENLHKPPVPATRRARSLSLPNPVLHVNGQSVGLETPYPNYSHGTSSSGPPLPPRSPQDGFRPKPPPPPRARRVSASPSPVSGGIAPPPIPAKIPQGSVYQSTPNGMIYQNTDSSSSTANILDDLKALQEEVDKIRDMTGGF